MYFSPHILQVLAEEKPKYDSNGQVIVKPENNTWETIGVCRCDDDNTQELKSDNGDMYMSHYHIVYERNVSHATLRAVIILIIRRFGYDYIIRCRYHSI